MHQVSAIRFVAIVLSILCVTTQAATVFVSPSGDDANDGLTWPTAKRTVQAGLNAAASGDQVWVAAATYVQCITLRAGVALYGGFAGTETDLAQRNWRTNVTTITGNSGNATLIVGPGSGLTTRIDGFTFGNGTTSSAPAISCADTSPTIANNTFTGNYGSSIGCSNASPLIVNNIITANPLTKSAIICTYSSSPTILNCTITGNLAADGAAIYCEHSSPTIINTIIAFNSSGIRAGYDSTPTLRNCCVYGNLAYDYSGFSDPIGSNGNISVDPRMPRFAYGNWHIQSDSPCVDGGDDAVPGLTALDMDGQPRKIGSHIDIGADESDGTVWPTGPNVIIRVAPDGDDANNGSSWTAPKRTIQAAVDAAAAAGGDVWVKYGTYVGYVRLRNYAHVYGGFAGTETGRAARDLACNVTILDGNHAGAVVRAIDLGSGLATIDGFTIRNGSSNYGGGILCTYSAPTIANNTITANTTPANGAGIYCFSSCPAITNNKIVGNAAPGTYQRGGGIYCDRSSPRIVGNTITGNAADYGGGIYCICGFPVILNNTISSNTATGSGGAIYCDSNTFATIASNAIVGNSAGYGTGGIYCYTTANVTITNNTIVGNAAPRGGCAIYIGSYYCTISNSIIAFNSSGIGVGNATHTSLAYNCVYGNTEFNYSGLSDPTGTNGNISANPMFTAASSDTDGLWGTPDDVYGDLHLLDTSPCRNTGDPAFVPVSGETDIDGQARVMAERVDIGADEFTWTGDANQDGYVDVVDLLTLVYAFGTYAGDPAYDPTCDFNHDGAIDVADLLDLVYNFGN